MKKYQHNLSASLISLSPNESVIRDYKKIMLVLSVEVSFFFGGYNQKKLTPDLHLILHDYNICLWRWHDFANFTKNLIECNYNIFKKTFNINN